jgi:O-antigen/teichoic acid export membrane protein
VYIRGFYRHITDCMTNDVPSRTFSQLLWVSAGRMALVGTWFVATILMGRVLGVVGFGLYVYCQTAIKIVTGCVGDPLDMAVMRQGPLLLKDNRPRALQLVRSAFWLRVLIGSLVLVAVILLPTLASRALFNRPDLHQLAMLTAGGVLGDFLLRSALGYFQIDEKFGRFMAVDSVWQGGRVVVVLVLVMRHMLTPTSAVGLYVAMPYVAFAVAWILLPSDVRQVAPPHRRDVTDILHYSKWIVTGMAMAAAYERLDVILLSHFKGDYELGIYAGALTWAVVPDFVNGILQTVLAPKIAPAYAAGTFNGLQKTYLKFAVPIGSAFAIFALPIAGWVLRTFMSSQYSASTNVYRILVLSTLFNTVFVPLPEALMNFLAPKRVTVYTAIGLIWVAVGGVILIPIYGAIGAAIVMLSARVIVGSIIMVQAHRIAGSHREIELVPLVTELPGHLEEPV